MSAQPSSASAEPVAAQPAVAAPPADPAAVVADATPAWAAKMVSNQAALSRALQSKSNYEKIVDRSRRSDLHLMTLMLGILGLQKDGPGALAKAAEELGHLSDEVLRIAGRGEEEKDSRTTTSKKLITMVKKRWPSIDETVAEGLYVPASAVLHNGRPCTTGMCENGLNKQCPSYGTPRKYQRTTAYRRRSRSPPSRRGSYPHRRPSDRRK